MDPDVKERVKANIPKSMNVYLLEEPYFPDAFYPGNGIIVICGYLAGVCSAYCNGGHTVI